MAIINNVAYSWSMITLASTALGIEEGSTVLEGVSGIKWSKKRKIEPNYGLGGKPVSRGFGNISYTASITMDYATQQTLRSTYGSLMDVGEFDLIISFANPMASDDGYVYYPDVNVVEEMADMMSASRGFETNVEVLNSIKSMQQSLLRLGEA